MVRLQDAKYCAIFATIPRRGSEFTIRYVLSPRPAVPRSRHAEASSAVNAQKPRDWLKTSMDVAGVECNTQHLLKYSEIIRAGRAAHVYKVSVHGQRQVSRSRRPEASEHISPPGLRQQTRLCLLPPSPPPPPAPRSTTNGTVTRLLAAAFKISKFCEQFATILIFTHPAQRIYHPLYPISQTEP